MTRSEWRKVCTYPPSSLFVLKLEARHESKDVKIAAIFLRQHIFSYQGIFGRPRKFGLVKFYIVPRNCENDRDPRFKKWCTKWAPRSTKPLARFNFFGGIQRRKCRRTNKTQGKRHEALTKSFLSYLDKILSYTCVRLCGQRKKAESKANSAYDSTSTIRNGKGVPLGTSTD